MRIGAATPFGQASVSISLPGGGQFYVPAGNYVVRLGQQTLLQWFDPNQLTWRNIARGNLGGEVQMSCDGFNYRLVNASGVVIGGLITNAGSGAVNGIGAAATGVSVTFGAAPASGVAAAAYPIVGGAINTTIAITNGGSGFVVPPLLVLDPPPVGGVQATARCTISAGVINAVVVDNAGAGYTSAPLVYIVPQYGTYPGYGVPVNPAGAPSSVIPPGLIGGSQPPDFPGINWERAPTGGAVLTVNPTLAGSGTLTGIVMTNLGAGYTSATIPTITITGAGAAAATAIMSMAVQSVAITVAGVAYSVAPIWTTNLGELVDGVNNDFSGARPAIGRTTVSAGAITAVTTEDSGFGFQSLPQIGVIQAGGTPATTVATLTPTCGGIADTSILQPAVQ